MNACCKGSSVSPFANPSMVVTEAPSRVTASRRQLFIRLPSTNTVQAPHWPWSQPFFVPVNCSPLAQQVEQRGPGLDLKRPAPPV